MANEAVDFSKLTPEAAYERIIEIGEKFIAKFPRPVYEVGKRYRFDHEPRIPYTYDGPINGGFQHRFTRTSDGAKATITKYARGNEPLDSVQ